MKAGLACITCALLAAAPARADACAETLRAFDYMMMVSRFTAQGAAKMHAARQAAVTHQKAGRIQACAHVLREAMGR